MSPRDAKLLPPLDPKKPKQLAGFEKMHFGAFFDRAGRENDYLWGRLDGAERLIGLVLGAGFHRRRARGLVPQGVRGDRRGRGRCARERQAAPRARAQLRGLVASCAAPAGRMNDSGCRVHSPRRNERGSAWRRATESPLVKRLVVLSACGFGNRCGTGSGMMLDSASESALARKRVRPSTLTTRLN